MFRHRLCTSFCTSNFSVPYMETSSGVIVEPDYVSLPNFHSFDLDVLLASGASVSSVNSVILHDSDAANYLADKVISSFSSDTDSPDSVSSQSSNV